MSTLACAIAIAAEAHKHQIDKAGAPYILHPLRVMFRMNSQEEQMAAVLHDVVEDTTWTLDKLRVKGFPERVIEAVEALTHSDEEDYFNAIQRAAAHPIARRVKRADIEDNLDLRRLADITERDIERLKRYKKALRLLD